MIFARLTGAALRRHLLSGANLGLLLMVVVLVAAVGFGVFLRVEADQSAIGYWKSLGAWGEDDPFAYPASDQGTAPATKTLWDAVMSRMATAEGGSILLPALRNAVTWLVFLLPLAAFVFSYDAVSRDLETGLAQTLHAHPVSRTTVGLANVLAITLTFLVTLGIGLPLGLAIPTWAVGVSWPAASLVRAATMIGVLILYSSAFVMLGVLISCRLRRSISALWTCLGVLVAIFLIHGVGENVAAAFPYAPDYPTARTVEVSTFFVMTPSADPPPEVEAYMEELTAYASAYHEAATTRYAAERWIAAVSPAHAVMAIANEVLQDRYRRTLDIFDPDRPPEAPAPVGASLAAAWPELVLLFSAWIALGAINVRILSRMEV